MFVYSLNAKKAFETLKTKIGGNCIFCQIFRTKFYILHKDFCVFCAICVLIICKIRSIIIESIDGTRRWIAARACVAFVFAYARRIASVFFGSTRLYAVLSCFRLQPFLCFVKQISPRCTPRAYLCFRGTKMPPFGSRFKCMPKGAFSITRGYDPLFCFFAILAYLSL